MLYINIYSLKAGSITYQSEIYIYNSLEEVYI